MPRGPRAIRAGAEGPVGNLLFFQGRAYRLVAPAPNSDSGVSLLTERVVGTTFARWQSSGMFAAGSEIYSVSGRPIEQLLAVKTDVAEPTVFFQVDSREWESGGRYLLEATQVVLGTVKSVGPSRWAVPGGAQPPPGQRQPGTVSTPATIAVERVLHGLIPTNRGEIEIRQMGGADETLPNGPVVPLTPGSRVILFLTPGQLQAIGDFGAGDYYWTGRHWIYGVEGDQVVPLGLSDAAAEQVSLEQFEAGLADVFRGVKPLDPYGPRPTPATLPAATTPVPTMPAPAPGGQRTDEPGTPTPAIGPTPTP